MQGIIFAAFVSFCIGAAGYVIIRFWILPIRRYKKVKQQISEIIMSHDFSGYNNNSFKLSSERAEALRKQSLALSNSYYDDLPKWYLMVLANRKESPADASKDLMTLSNTRDMEHVKNRISHLRQCLKL